MIYSPIIKHSIHGLMTLIIALPQTTMIIEDEVRDVKEAKFKEEGNREQRKKIHDVK